MTRDVFARATTSVLRRLGKDARLRGAPAGKVHVEHDVELYERASDGEALVRRSVATIEKQYAPKRGDVLELLDTEGAVIATYSVQGLHSDNGYAERRVVMPTEA